MKLKFSNEQVYEACYEEHEINPQVLTLFKPTLDFIIQRFKYSPATAWTKLQNIIREYDLNLAPTLKGLPYLSPERGVVINYFNLAEGYRKNGYQTLYLKVRELEKKYKDEDKIKEKLYDWWKTWKHKDFYQPIYTEPLSDKNTITTLDRQKTKPDTSLIDELCC